MFADWRAYKKSTQTFQNCKENVKNNSLTFLGNVSRNLIKAEEMLDASRIQNNFWNNESQNLGSLSKRFSDGGAEEMNNSTASFLFPHLLKKRKGSSPEPKPFKISELVSPAKPVDPSPNNDRAFSPDLSAEADLFEDEPESQLIRQTPETKNRFIFKSPETEEKEVSFASLRKPLRRLFNDEDDDLVIFSQINSNCPKTMGCPKSWFYGV